MTVYASTSGSVDLPLGDLWTIAVRVVDSDGDPAYVAPVITVTDPAFAATTPTVVDDGGGCYHSAVSVVTAGRYVARAVSAGYGAADFAAWVSAVVIASGMPSLAQVKTYIGTTSYADADIQDAMDAEFADQRRRCNVPAEYPPNLSQAFKRRVARNLILRSLPIAVLRGDSESGDAVRIPMLDSEIRRFEAGHRRVNVG